MRVEADLSDDVDLERGLAEVDALAAKARAAVDAVVIGQSLVVEQSIITLLSGGHLLLVGAPGLAKTRLAETLGAVFGLDERRVQCTPDLMPADIIGSEVLEEGNDGRRHFRFIEGPVFTQILMADEINRASPRTQSALLQAMQEKKVAVSGVSRPLPEPFHVLATQNPIEQEGTYPLPEAQLDRFLMDVRISYPARDDERSVLIATTGAEQTPAVQVMDAKTLMNAQSLIRRAPISDGVVDAILTLVRNGRPESSELDAVKRHLAWGPGPRAGQALMLATRARAALDGRLAPSVDDVAALARPVLRHRMAPTFAARAEGVGVDDVLDALVASLS
ncbi:MAG: MoxR family ATPase [Pseudomonadota bacterium]